MRFDSYLSDITTKIDDYIKEDLIFEEIKTILNELEMVQAIEYAEQMHKGQIRKGNKEPYVTHPKAVYNILKSFGVKDRVLLVAAWLHDTIEDTKATYNTIKSKFNKEVANLVKAVSSDKKEINKIGKEVYLLKKMIKMNNNELILKLADRLHNTSDITKIPDKLANKTYNQTKYILTNLKDKRTLNKTHKKIIRAIERNLDKYEI